MKKSVYTIVFLSITQCLLACGGNLTRPEGRLISSSHSVYIEGGVLKVLSGAAQRENGAYKGETDQQNILYVYVRPEVLDRWVVAGGGGGIQPSPWHHKSTLSWALGDEDGWFDEHTPRKEFSFLFDSRDMTLTIERGTYAVNEGDFIVISLNKNWQPDTVKSGLEALRIFELPDQKRQQLLSEARKHYSGRFQN